MNSRNKNNKIEIEMKYDEAEINNVISYLNYNDDYKDKTKDYNWIIGHVITNTGKPKIPEEFFQLLDRFIHLVSIHQTALDRHIRIEKGMIKNVDNIQQAGLSDKNYEEMKKIAIRLKELKEQMGE